MNKFVRLKELEKAPYIPSCDIACARHCAMNAIVEEVFGLTDLNLLVVGTGECVFYAQKQPFGANRRNWGYRLTDEEIVFGDMLGVKKALEEISDNGLKTVCVFTCIPCVMNLDGAEVLDGCDAIKISAPDYKGISSYDVVDELYFRLLKNADIRPSGGVAVWDNDFTDTVGMINNLQASTHVVRNVKYMKALGYLKEKCGIEVIDDVHFHDTEFYRAHKAALGLSDAVLDRIDAAAKKLKGKRLNIKSAMAYELALFLRGVGCEVGTLIFRIYNADAYARCAELDGSISASLDYSAVLPNDAAVNIDISPFDERLYGERGAARLCAMLEKTEELCRQ